MEKIEFFLFVTKKGPDRALFTVIVIKGYLQEVLAFNTAAEYFYKSAPVKSFDFLLSSSICF